MVGAAVSGCGEGELRYRNETPCYPRGASTVRRHSGAGGRSPAVELIEFVREDLKRLHNTFDRGTADLTPAQWHAIPGGPQSRANSIAFEMWHYARTEDNVVRYIVQSRPTVWMDGNWAVRLGLPERVQGTGMSTEEAHALRIQDLGAFKQYVQDVWASTNDFLERVDPAALDAVKLVRPLGEMPLIRALTQVCLTHGFQHIGQLDLTRTLIGAPNVGI
jgi:hypothetical protein